MICKTCYSIGRIFPLKIEKFSQGLYTASCTNPNHSSCTYCEWVWNGTGWNLRPVQIKQSKQSHSTGDTVYYHDGKKEHKISRSHLAHIRSRAVTPDGEVLYGAKGEAYHVKHGTQTQKDVING